MPLSQPIMSKNKINRDLVLHFRQFARFYFEFSLARKSISFLPISCYDHSSCFDFGFAALSKSSLTIIMNDM